MCHSLNLINEPWEYNFQNMNQKIMIIKAIRHTKVIVNPAKSYLLIYGLSGSRDEAFLIRSRLIQVVVKSETYIPKPFRQWNI